MMNMKRILTRPNAERKENQIKESKMRIRQKRNVDILPLQPLHPTKGKEVVNITSSQCT